MSTWNKVLLEDANITVGTITPSLTDIAGSLTALNHPSVELVVLDGGQLKTVTANFDTGAFNPVTSDTDTIDMGSGFTVSATTDTNATTITENDDLFFAAGTGITCETTAVGTVTIGNSSPFVGDEFDEDGNYSGLRAQATTKADVGLGNVENTALSTYTGSGGALDNQYITNGANYTTLVLGTSGTTALAGDTTILTLGTSSTTALAGNTTVNGVSSANLLNGLALLDNSATIVIGDDSDTTVKIAGNLEVTGTTQTISTTELRVEDITIAVASGSATAATANNAGLEVDIDTDATIDANPAILYQSTGASFSDFKMRKSVTAKSDAFIAAMTTADNTTDLDALTPGIGTFAMVSGDLYIQTGS